MTKFRKQSGDTIIEVLIVLAVVGFALGISYATANRSLLATRQAQETSGAVALLQSQIEALRTMYSSNPGQFTSKQNNYYCVTGNPGSYVISSQINPASGAPNITSDKASYTSSGCVVGAPPYYVYFIYTVDPSGDNATFTANAQWDDVAGQGEDSSTLIYKVN